MIIIEIKLPFKCFPLFVLFVSMILITPSSFAQPTGYVGGTLETYQHGTINGDILFTIGDSKYRGELSPGTNYSVVFDTIVPEGSMIKVARLYLYWTWSYNGSNGTYPEMDVQFEGNSIAPDKEYTDRKGSGNYDYPSGTYAYDVTDSIAADKIQVTVENKGLDRVFSVNGAGLLLIYEHPDLQRMEYWIDEGTDMIRTEDENTSEKAFSTAYFKGVIDTANISSARLITVVPSGDKGKNNLYFNSMEWEGVYEGDPYDQLAIDTRDVTDYLQHDNNLVKIEDKGDYLIPSNAFLILKFAEPSSNQDSARENTPGFEAVLLIACFLAVVSLVRYARKRMK